MAGSVSGAALNKRTCLFPEPERKICYSDEGSTLQDLDEREIKSVAEYLRAYQEEMLSKGGSPFWKMPLPDADNCDEWQAGVLFADIAATIDGLTLDDPSTALLNCNTTGGQMATIVDEASPSYQTQLFEGFTNKGIITKLVKSPS
ncbi:hypothetical protein B0I37DRAFT_416189 [Chaetomium sp. MPI-CAGE-AT-0009]|nr:hypothetical protein B0I37DRAFT_416189 [Chaetomium sp. MPI-CAGE-AT-0009]